MPIQLLYTDKEILKLRANLLKRSVLNNADLILLAEINDYVNS
jgi:hypothetical protein